MKSSDVSAGLKGRISQYNDLRDDAYLSSMLLAHEQAVPDLTLYVEPGIAYFGALKVEYAGGNSPSFTAPAANPRIDALVLNKAGALARIAGAENASPVAPKIPNYYIPICYVYNRVGQTTVRDASVSGQGYIQKDLRSASQLPTFSSENVSYTYNGDGTMNTVTDVDTNTTYTFTYNAAGNVATITDGSNTWTLSYTDGLLTSVART